MRVLKPGGSIFVNLGDKYAQNIERSRNGHGGTLVGTNPLRDGPNYSGRLDNGVRTKSLIGLPWRYAIRCIDELGLILRAEIVWAKPNGLPESVTDRVRRSHEQVFHFVKQPRYFSAVDEVRESYEASTQARAHLPRLTTAKYATAEGQATGGSTSAASYANNPLGKLPGSVWAIPTAPLRVPESLGIDHFAAYPPELVRRIVLGWSPREVCTACGEGRRPVVSRATLGKSASYDRTRSTVNPREWLAMKAANPDTITGYACACPDTTAPATPGVVLDPFGGTGTTALVASCYGRVGISVDLSADYCRLAQWRTTDEKQRAKVAALTDKGKPKQPKRPKSKPPAEVIDLPAGQIDLFGELTA